MRITLREILLSQSSNISARQSDLGDAQQNSHFSCSPPTDAADFHPQMNSRVNQPQVSRTAETSHQNFLTIAEREQLTVQQNPEYDIVSNAARDKCKVNRSEYKM